MPRFTILLTLSLVACSTVEVAPDVEPADSCPSLDADQLPNGYCERDADCDAADHCLAVWCGGSSDPADCEDVNRCARRQPEGGWCEGPTWCREGLVCNIPTGLKASTCEAP